MHRKPECSPDWKPDWCGIIDVICDSYAEHGPYNSENSYVNKTFFKLYELGVPAIRERKLYSVVNGVSISRGRVDLEVAGKFLFEFKIIEPSPTNLRKNARQLIRYLQTYAEAGTPIQKAALVYLFANEVRVVEVSIEKDKKWRYSPYPQSV